MPGVPRPANRMRLRLGDLDHATPGNDATPKPGAARLGTAAERPTNNEETQT